MYKLQSQVKATTSVRLIMLLGPFPLEAGKQNCKVLTQAILFLLLHFGVEWKSGMFKSNKIDKSTHQ